MIRLPLCRATFRPRYSSGRKITVSESRAVHHLGRVARGAADVTLGFDVGVGVDVGHHRHPRVLGLEPPDVLGGDARGQRAAGFFRRDQHRLVRAQDLGGLRHEFHPAEDDDVAVGRGRLPAQLQGVPGKIRDGVEQVGRHVVMGQDHGVFFLFELEDLTGQLGLAPQLGPAQPVLQVCFQLLGHFFDIHAILFGSRIPGVF